MLNGTENCTALLWGKTDTGTEVWAGLMLGCRGCFSGMSVMMSPTADGRGGPMDHFNEGPPFPPRSLFSRRRLVEAAVAGLCLTLAASWVMCGLC